jgi:UDP-glucose 4-epimerase
MRVVVTGGAGFIGANLCRRLLSEPEVSSVAVIDDLSTGQAANLEGVDVELTIASILDQDAVHEVCAGAATIVHLGALGSVPRSIDDPLTTHHANATGTLHVLQAARQSGRGGAQVIVAGSSSVYGATTDLPKHEALPTRPVSPYGASKLATEWYALAFQHSYGLPVLAFRFFNVFGPLQAADHAYAAVIPRFMAAAFAGRPLTVQGDGLQSRDFTYVATVCDAITKATVRRITHPEPVNLAFGDPHDLLSVIAEIEAILGRRLEIEHVEPRAGDVRASDADSTVVRSLIPDLSPVPFTEGLHATIDWFSARDRSAVG